MQKYFLLLAIFSFPSFSMYSPISTSSSSTEELYAEFEETPVCSNSLTIVEKNFFRDKENRPRWYELEVVLSNNDRITYTEFPQLNNASACIYAQFISPHCEVRFNAPLEWQEFMKELYQNHFSRKKSSL